MSLSSSQHRRLRLLQEDFQGDVSTGGSSSGTDPYTTTGFIVWYCLLVGIPVACCCAGFGYSRWRRRRSATGRSNSQPQDDPELSQMEANIVAYSEQEQARRKLELRRTLRKHSVCLTEAHLSRTVATQDQHAEEPDACNKKESDNEPAQPPTTSSSGEMQQPKPSVRSSHLRLGCTICLTSYKVGDTVTFSFASHCRHAFHLECIVSWFATRQNSFCPYCRQTFVAPQLQAVFQSSETISNPSTTSITSASDPFFEDPSSHESADNEGETAVPATRAVLN